jgi:hypothetical protein
MQSVYLQAYNQYDDRARDETLSALFEVLVSRQAELEQLEGKIGLPVPGRQEQLQQELNAFAQKCGVQPGQILELSPVILAKIETVQGEIFWPEQDSVVYLGVSGTCTPLTASIRGGEYHKVAQGIPSGQLYRQPFSHILWHICAPVVRTHTKPAG